MNDTLDGRNQVEMLAEEFLERQRNGEHPSVNEYAAAHPELADEIREVFPAVALMENLRPESADFDPQSAEQKPPEVLTRETIGDYRIVREIGRGGMGVVYEAEQQSLGRRVAVKVLPRHSAGSSDSLQRFRREARAAARLHHTNIVPVFEVGQDDDTFYYAMQFIEGQGLDRVQRELSRLRDESEGKANPTASAFSDPHANTFLVKRGEKAEADTINLAIDDTANVSLPGRSQLSSVHSNQQHYFRSVARIGHQAADALQHAHNHGIIHRDIKPANLILDAAGVVWITDFGLAQTDEDALTKTGDIIGTLRYMSPERFNGECDERADVYGLGMTLYELLTFRTAFRARDHLNLIDEIANRAPARPRQINSAIPRDLETIVLKSIDKDPRRRYATAEEFATDLKRFIDGEPVKARRVSMPEKLLRWAGRNRAAAACLSTLILMLCSWVFVATAAAAHYSEREKEQRQLADQKGKIARQQEELAEQAAKEKTAAEQIAETRRKRLVRFNVDRGSQYMEDGDLLGSLPWFVEALRLDEGNPEREKLHRTRLAAVWARCPKPIQLWKYQFSPNDMEYSQDGRFLAVACGHRATVSDTITGEAVFDLKHDWSAQIARISPDGEFVVVVEAARSLGLFDLPSGKRRLEPIEVDADISCVAISPDGDLIAVGDSKGVTKVFEVKSGEAIGTPIVHNSRVECVTFSPNARFVLTGSRDRTARVWLSQTGTPWGPPLKHDDVVTFVAYRPDKARVLTASNDRTARLWGITTGQKYGVMKHRSLVVDARFSPDSKKVVTASYDQTAQVWDANTGKSVTPPLQHQHHVLSARFSSDSKRIVTASEDRTARIWDSSTGREVTPPLRHADLLINAEFHPDGQHVATTTPSGVVRQWRIEGEDNMTPLQRHGSHVVDVDITDDGRRMVTASRDRTARVWDVETGRPLSPPLVHNATVTSVQFSPDGSRVVTGSLDFSIRIWDTETGQPLTPGLSPAGWNELERNEFQDRVQAVFSHDGQRVAGGFGSFTKRAGMAVVWDVETGEPVGAPMPHDGRLVDLQFSPDDTRLATADLEKKARVWQVNEGKQLVEIPHAGSVHSVRFSPDGEQLVTASGFRTVGEARVWNATTGEALTPPMRHQGSVEVAAFSPDGLRVATSSYDHTARVWNATTGEPLTPPIPHGDQVRYIEFSPNGQYIVTCGWGMYFDDVPLRGVRVWDAETGQPVTPLPLKHANTAIAKFQHDSQGVAVAATREQGGKVWKLEPDDRPLKDWEAFARLVSGQTIDSTGTMTPADVKEIIAIYESLRSTRPDEFNQSPDQRLVRLEDALDRCIQKRQWRVAKSYVETLRQTGQAGDDLQRRANEVAWAILTGPDVDQYDEIELLELASFGVPKAKRASPEPIEWHVLTPLSIRSTSGAALIVQDDSSVLAAGDNPKSDSYIIICDTSLEGVTGLRLETLPDNSLPKSGPGRHVSGNFVLSEFSLEVQPIDSSDGSEVVELTRATAEFNQDGWPASATIDSNDLTGWSVTPHRGGHHVVFQIKKAIQHEGGSRLVIKIDSQDPIRFMHNLGRFRLSATTAQGPLGVEQFAVQQSGNLAGSWTTLALAQFHGGDAKAALDSLNVAHRLNDGGSVYDWLLKSLVHWELEDHTEALNAFSQADALLTSQPINDPIRRLYVAALAHRADSEPDNADWPTRRSHLLFALGRDEEGLAALSQAVDLDPQNVELLKSRATWLARRSRWSEAADDYQSLYERKPDDHFNAYLALSLLYLSDRVNDYHKLRSQVLEQFGKTSDVHISERLGKTCLLDANISEEEFSSIQRMTDHAIARGSRDSSLKWFHGAAALTDYRAQRYQDALRHTTDSLRLARSTDESLKALALLINAMCYHQMGNSSAARWSFDSATKIFNHTTVAPKDGVLPTDWYNWAVCLILEREARITLELQTPE